MIDILALAGTGIGFVCLLRWVIAYTTRDELGNGCGLPGFDVIPAVAKDSTVSAYQRQIQQHARENDAHAERARTGPHVQRTVEIERLTKTEERTGG